MLLTDEIRKQIPNLNGTENEDDPLVTAKFFSPWSGWAWYGIEFDGEDVFFGIVDGDECEWGYFSLAELESVMVCDTPAVERDLNFRPARLSQIPELSAARK